MKNDNSMRALVNERDAATYLGVSQIFLAKSRMNGQVGQRTPGPNWIKAGRMVRYSIEDLDLWIEEHRQEFKGRLK